jgi:uncharacterized protein (TIGR02996 family)
MTSRVTGKNRREKRQAWDALLARRDRDSLPVLLAALPMFRCADAVTLLDQLDSWLPDRRALGPLVELLQTPPQGFIGEKAQPFWRRVLAMLARCADQATLVALRGERQQLERSLPSWWTDGPLDYADEWCGIEVFLYEQLGELIEQLDAAAAAGELQPTRASAPAADRAADRAADTAGLSVDQLLARVQAEPDVASWRLVLGDHLSERGDSRGELIALQHQQAPTKAQLRRQAQLLRAHGRAWLGKLAPVLRKEGIVFRGGFLAEAALKECPTRQRRAVCELEEWATVEALDVGQWRGATETQTLLEAETMRSLRRVDGLFGPAELHMLEEAAARWRAVSFFGALNADELAELCRPLDLPDLRELSLDCNYLRVSDLETFWSTPLFAQLRRLTVRCDQIRDYAPLWSELDLDMLCLLPGDGDDSGGWALELRADAGATRARFHYGWRSAVDAQSYDRLERFIRRLPKIAVVEVEIKGSRRAPPSAAQQELLRRAVARWSR